MTRTEIEREIEHLKDEIFYEEMADLGYNFSRVSELRMAIRKLEEKLEKN